MQTRYYIGPAGWSYPDWAGVVYPPKKPKGFDPLEYISSYFNTVEINSTFYRIPARETAQSWADRVQGNPAFRFSLKAHQDISHGRTTAYRQTIAAFTKSISPLLDAGRLICVLLQFPWSFRNTKENRAWIERVAAGFRPFPLAVELRHGGWARDDAIESIAEGGITVCAVDQPAVGNSISLGTHRAGDPGVYFRMHGRNKSEWFKRDTNRDLRYNYLYSNSELSPVADAVRAAAKHTHTAVVVMNNHFRGQAVANALEMKSMLLEKKVRVPQHLVKTYPRLRRINSADPDDRPQQGSLFDRGFASEDEFEQDED